MLRQDQGNESLTLPDMSSDPQTLLKEITSGRFYRSRDNETVTLLGRVFGNELEHLQLASPTVESGAIRQASHPRTISGLKSPSLSLYGLEYSEINRTMLSALALKWILRDDYENFTLPQDSHAKLTRKTFEELRDYFKEWLKDPEDVRDLIVALVTSDLGKDPKVVDQLLAEKQLTDKDVNHDIITYTAATNNYFPTLKLLPDERREDIILGLKFAASTNIPQLVQAECVPGNLKGALILKDRPRALAMKCMEIFLDVAGAFGHKDTRGAMTMTESVVGSYKATFSALMELLDGSKTMRECYDSVLEYRRELLERKGFIFKLPNKAEDHAFLRLLCIGRVDDSELARIFLRAFENLPPTIHQALVDGLNVDAIEDGIAVLPYYMPGLVALALTSHSNISNETKEHALAGLFRFLTRVLGGTKPMPGQPGQIVERNLAFARDCIGSDEFLENSQILDKLELQVPPLPEVEANGKDGAAEEVTNGT